MQKPGEGPPIEAGYGGSLVQCGAEEVGARVWGGAEVKSCGGVCVLSLRYTGAETEEAFAS